MDAEHSPDDFCMKLLILKILYVLFSTKGTAEYFYTNDLCVLVDVFLRELADMEDESESVSAIAVFKVALVKIELIKLSASTHLPPSAASTSYEDTTTRSAL